MYVGIMGFLIAQLVKNPPAMQETLVRFLGQEDPLEKGKATHSSILAWRIPCIVSKGSQRVRKLSAKELMFLNCGVGEDS